MSLWESIVLGLVQGLTEFLPVSSSGHIELGKAIFNIHESEAGLLFTVILHFATALSTIVVFRNDIISILSGIFKFKWNPETKFSLLILISMLPAAAVGVLLKDKIDGLYIGNVTLVSIMLLLTGFLLYVSDRLLTQTKDINMNSAILLGITQAVAILPGISRSGSTIAIAVLLGIQREKAARFSFLMVLPLIFGAMAKEILDFSNQGVAQPSSFIIDIPLIAGFLSALIAGVFACKWMIAIVKKSKLSYFAYYCWIIGIIGIAFSLLS